MDITNKAIIVTGASMGIGEATARLLHERGARVVLAARSTNRLNALARELPGSLPIEVDMRDPSSIASLIDQTHQEFGRIDGLINNAGQGLYAPVEDIDPHAFAEIWRLNILGALIAMQQAIPRMRNLGGGSIVNISSVVSKNYFTGMAAYASTKHGLNALTLTARQELAPDNIVVSLVHPGLTDTYFGANAVQAPESRRAGKQGGDSPARVAERILYALESGEPEVYVR